MRWARFHRQFQNLRGARRCRKEGRTLLNLAKTVRGTVEELVAGVD